MPTIRDDLRKLIGEAEQLLRDEERRYAELKAQHRALMATPHELEQRVNRLAFRLSRDDAVYDDTLKRITLLVSEALDYQRGCDAAQIAMVAQEHSNLPKRLLLRASEAIMDAEPVCIEKKWDSSAYQAACQRQERHEQRIHDNYVADEDEDT